MGFVVKKHWSFSIIQKMAMLTFLNKSDLKIKIDTVVSHIYFDTKVNKCKRASKFVQLITITNLFPFEIVQKFQHCQLLYCG